MEIQLKCSIFDKLHEIKVHISQPMKIAVLSRINAQHMKMLSDIGDRSHEELFPENEFVVKLIAYKFLSECAGWRTSRIIWWVFT